MALRPFWLQSARAGRGYATSSPMVAMQATNYAMPLKGKATGPWRSSSAPTPPRALRFYPGDGSSNGPLHGSIEIAASQRTSRKPSPALPHGSSSHPFRSLFDDWHPHDINHDNFESDSHRPVQDQKVSQSLDHEFSTRQRTEHARRKPPCANISSANGRKNVIMARPRRLDQEAARDVLRPVQKSTAPPARPDRSSLSVIRLRQVVMATPALYQARRRSAGYRRLLRPICGGPLPRARTPWRAM